MSPQSHRLSVDPPGARRREESWRVPHGETDGDGHDYRQALAPALAGGGGSVEEAPLLGALSENDRRLEPRFGTARRSCAARSRAPSPLSDAPRARQTPPRALPRRR